MSAAEGLDNRHGVSCYEGKQTGLCYSVLSCIIHRYVSPQGSEAQGPRDQHSLLKICAHLITEEKGPLELA